VTLAMMGRDLRARRRALGLTQVALAEAVGTRPVMVGRWERGEALPTMDEALRLAEVLDLDPSVAAGWSALALPPSPDPAPQPEEAVFAPARRWPFLWLARLQAVWAARPLRRTEEEEAPRERPPGGSYLDDPAEQRRYALRWALTLLLLGVLAVGLVWALAELWEGWGAFLDLFRGRPTGTGSTRALASLLVW